MIKKLFSKDYWIIKRSGLFDAEYYLRTYPDVREADIDPIWHYCAYGWREGRNPSSRFDTSFYLASYTDVKDAGVNPLAHYVRYGVKENRKPFANFVFVQELSCFERIKQLIKSIYLRFPFLGYMKDRCYYYLKMLKSKSVELSLQNTLAVTELTKRRFAYSDSYFKNKQELRNKLDICIDVTIVTYNSSKWVEQFIESLVAQKYPTGNMDIYFVDNNSSDNTVELLKQAKIKFENKFNSFNIISQENVGFGSGHDRAIRIGKSEYCLVTNIDLIFDSNSILNVMLSAQNDYDADYASWEFRQIPYEHPKYYDPVTLETNWSSHACILIRRSAYEKVGGYESKIFMYGEDVELSYRFRAHGYHLKYCPDAVVSHFTYDYPDHFKPVQFEGSILANAYIRLRYGNFLDKLAIIPLYVSLVKYYRGENKILAKIIRKNILKIITNSIYFINFRKKHSSFYAPFRGFDYELIREGAFYDLTLPKEKPLVSVIVRTYQGRQKLLMQCVISILNQTYQNIEIIVVEDGGCTMKQLFEENLFKLEIKYFSLGKVGRSAAGNFGMKNANGEYFVFLDDDDLFFADHVEVLVESMQKNLEASAAYSLAYEIPTKFLNNKESYVESSFVTHAIYDQEFSFQVLNNYNYFPIQCVLFKKELFTGRGGFDESLTYLEDWNLWLRYAYGNKFVYNKKITSLYRVPSDVKEKSNRHILLHNAYNEAREKSMKAIRILETKCS